MKKIELLKPETLEEKLAENLQHHRMPDYLLYTGETGSSGWLELHQSPGFGISRQLTELLVQNISLIAAYVPAGMNVVSIGVGDGKKEKILLTELCRLSSFTYYPVDISSPLVDLATEQVKDLPLEVVGLVGFFEDLSVLRIFWELPVMFCLLGNTFCNYEPDEVLRNIGTVLNEDDLFLFDCSLYYERPETRRKIESTYRCPENVNFNIGPLLRCGMRPNDCEFRLDLKPAPTLEGPLYRTSKVIRILKDSIVQCAGRSVELKAGEIIEMGFTYKYTIDQLNAFLRKHGFRILRLFKSRDQGNVLFLAQKEPARGN